MPVTLGALWKSFMFLGLTSFGGVWASVARMEDELVQRRGWITASDMATMLVTVTFVPAPRFLSLAGMVGHRLRGWTGGAVAVLAVGLPTATLTVLAVWLIRPEALAGPMVPIQRAVAVAVVGILFGSARRQVSGATVCGTQLWLGRLLGLGIMAAVSFGTPIWLTALAGLAAGTLFIRGENGS